jgi:hypothetical protein
MTDPILFDQQGPIRYDWPSIKLLYVGGASHSDIATALTKNQPDLFDRVRAAIAQSSSRDDWPSLRQLSIDVVQSRPDAVPNNHNTVSRLKSHDVTLLAASTHSARKNRYLDITSKFLDRAATTLDQRRVDTLEQAAMAAKLMQPVHEIARDIHGLSSKDGVNQVNVNILSQWAETGPLLTSEASDDFSREGNREKGAEGETDLLS